MKFGVCDISIIVLRAEPSDKSEMVSQLLFGEVYTVLITKENWLKISVAHDGYEGWMDAKQFHSVDEKYFLKASGAETFSFDIMQPAISSERQIPLLLGSLLTDFDGMNFRLSKEKFVYNGQAITADHRTEPIKMLEKVAFKYLHAPYLWGGRTPFGIDCSGFTQMVCRLLGVRIPRDAYQQADGGQLIDYAHEAKAGDFAYFENKDGKVTHTGIILSHNRIIHASGRVRVDKLDSFGIYNKDLKKYTHNLSLIRRFF